MAVKIEAYIDLELSLQQLFQPQWNKIQNRVVPQIVKAIGVHDMEKALQIVDTIDTSTLYQGQTKAMTNILKTALVFGASLINGNTVGLGVVSNRDALDLVPISVDQLKIMFDQTQITVRKNFLQLITKTDERLTYEENFDAEAELNKSEDGVSVQKINRINLMGAVNKGATNIGAGAVNVASSLQMSRMANYGFLAEADSRGITTYIVNEQLDSRTCAVCRRMHGRRFEVPSALAKLDTQIRITDPSDMKLLAPFPKQSKAGLKELDSMSSEQLRAKGFDTPPYHPHCRGLLKAVKKPQVVQPTTTQRLNPNTPDEPFTSASDYYLAGDSAVTEAAIVDALAASEQAALAEFEGLMSTVKPTTDTFRNTVGQWSADRAKLHDDIVQKLILGDNRTNINAKGVHRAVASPNEAPKYTLLAGRDGTNKSWLTSNNGPVDGSKTLTLNTETIKTMLPEYKGWNAFAVHEESSYLLGETTKVAKQMRMNVAHVVTLKTGKSAKQSISQFANAGYVLEGYYLYIPRQEAATRSVSKSLSKSDRYVPLDVVLSNTENEAVFDSIRPLLSRWGMWDDFVPKGTPPKVVGLSY